MTPDQDPTRVIPRHTGTGHIPAVDPDLVEQFTDPSLTGTDWQRQPRTLPPAAGRVVPLWQHWAGWLTVALLLGLLALVLRFNLILWHVHLGGRWP